MVLRVRDLRMVFGTGHGLRIFVSNLLAAFGLTSATVQFFGQLFPPIISRPHLVTASTMLCCLAWSVARAYPRRHFRREFRQPEIAVSVEFGDLFDQDSHIVVGFSDTFDTSTANDRIINSSSLQGQLLQRRYDGDRRRLDRELAKALSQVSPIAVERRGTKRAGKLQRYEIGTVAVIGAGQPKRVFAIAYSRMGNDLVTRSSVDDIWIGLSRLWDAVYLHAQQSSVAIPLIGSGLARVDLFERNNLLRIIMLSFLARSRQAVVCRELRIIIWPGDIDRVDMLDAEVFLRNL